MTEYKYCPKNIGEFTKGRVVKDVTRDRMVGHVVGFDNEYSDNHGKHIIVIKVTWMR